MDLVVNKFDMKKNQKIKRNSKDAKMKDENFV